MKPFLKHLLKPIMTASMVLFAAAPVFALDGDDEIKPDNPEERIAYEPTNAESAKVERKFPTEAQEIRDAIARHVKNANDKNIDAYMNDFISERIRHADLERDYAQRAMQLAQLKLEIEAIEFDKLARTTATVHTRQMSTYTDEAGKKHRDHAIISYRWMKDATDGVWRIAFTERRRIVAE